MDDINKFETEHGEIDDEDDVDLPLTKSSFLLQDQHNETELLPREKPVKKYSCCLEVFCVRAEHIEDKEKKIRATLRELFVYTLFLIVLCFLVFNTASLTMYQYTKIMKDLFVDTESKSGLTFDTIGTAEDFWEYARGPLLDSLYWNNWYNGKDLKNISGYIYYENKLLGLPRLRQLRIESSNCLVSDDFKLYIHPCYNEYSSSKEDTEPFGKGIKDPNATAWHYQSAGAINGFWFWGKLATYSGAGFVQDLPPDRGEAELIMNDLFDNLWIQRGTRIVFITFSMYNANINLFSVIRLTVEFPATGGAVPTWSIDTEKFVHRLSSYNVVIHVMEVVFIIFIFLFSLEEIIQIKSEGIKYLSHFWNFFDLLLIFLSGASIALHVVSNQFAAKKVTNFVDNEQDSYADFLFVAFWKDISLNVQAITAFVGFIKVFKYIGFNKTMIQLSLTLSTCAKDLAGFFIMFFIVFLAFTQLGYLLFGSQLKDFSTFMSSFYTLFRIILGDFNFHQLEQANSILGPIFFMLFVFFVFFVLINMFLAIINDTYSEIKSDVAKRAEVYIMSDYLKETYLNVLTKLNASHDKVKKLSSAVLDGRRKSSVIKLDEWKANLYMQGFTDEEIEPIFNKYDKNRDMVLDAEEKKLMMEELQNSREKKQSIRSINDEVNEEQKEDDGNDEFLHYSAFLDLSKRVDRMEDAITKLVYNVAGVLEHVSRK